MKGAYEIIPFYATDIRGGFIKDYNIDVFNQNGIDHELKEAFYTISKKGVIRAMHFQFMKQQAKLIHFYQINTRMIYLYHFHIFCFMNNCLAYAL